MPHYLYQTESFIIGGRPINDGSRLLDLLTQDFGRISVLAQGARELRSKLRYRLTDLTFFQATLVRGREFWRLVGAASMPDLDLVPLLSDSSQKILVARLALLLRRFLASDELSFDRELYTEVRSALTFLNRHDLSAEEVERYEVAAVWRILAKLGYGRRTATLEAILIPKDWGHDLLALTATCQAEVVASINEALYHSQL